METFISWVNESPPQFNVIYTQFILLPPYVLFVYIRGGSLPLYLNGSVSVRRYDFATANDNIVQSICKTVFIHLKNN